MFSVPVLLITFNRPNHVREVLSVIRHIRPETFYVFQDGPREGREDDVEKIMAVRNVISELVDWPCRLHTLFQENNLGCGPGPAGGITWFFNNVDSGIIIEDDAVPHPDFFRFAEEMLLRYKNHPSVRAIGSMNLDERVYGDGSYYFSMMNRTLCAWATWRRAWKDFDLFHRTVTRKYLNTVLKGYKCALRMREYWCDILKEVQEDAYHYSSWDQQFWISIWIHNGKGIMPNVNLCRNIGFDAEATHTSDIHSSGANREVYPLYPIRHPSDENIIHEADQRFQEIYFEPWNYGREGRRRLIYRINRRLKRLVGHKGPWFCKKPFKFCNAGR